MKSRLSIPLWWFWICLYDVAEVSCQSAAFFSPKSQEKVGVGFFSSSATSTTRGFGEVVASTTRLHGMKISIRIVGRKSGSEQWLDDASTMYETRLRPSNVEVETTWHKDNTALIKGVDADKKKGHTVVLLDPLGATKTSEKFAEDMYEWLDRGGSRLSFVIGGAEGLPVELKYPNQTRGSGPSKPHMISLSALTFTHQFARVLLIEQIYRATEIRKGSGYHK